MLARQSTVPSPPNQRPQISLPRAENRQGRLLHGYLHKTSNSLCGIKGYASLIVDGIPLDGCTERWARKIIAEVEQLEAIYRSVQDMAFPAQKQSAGADLDATLRRAVIAAERRHPNLCVRCCAGPPGDLLLPAHDLELALAEILANCAEGDGDTAAVQVTVRTLTRGDRSLALLLRDDGPGLRPGLINEAADPFVTTKAGHLGIGLARVDTLMDMYGLNWTLRSLPGMGTAIELTVAMPRDGGRSEAAKGSAR